MKASRFLATALMHLNDILDLSSSSKAFECVFPRKIACQKLNQIIEASFLGGHEIWILGQNSSHPALEILRPSEISLWVEENIGSGEHGLLIEPASCQICFFASYDEGNEDIELYVSIKRGVDLEKAYSFVF